jgi:cytochrome P450
MLHATSPYQANRIPAHVPAAMIGDFNFFLSPGMTPTPFGDPQLTTSRLHAGPPIFYASPGTRGGEGAWVVVRAEDQRRVLQDPQTFSSYRQIFSGGIGEDWPLIPLELDPPQHTTFRNLLNPLLSPRRVLGMEPQVRAQAAELIEALKKRGSSCEFMKDFAFPFAVSIFLQFLGIPTERLREFISWGHDSLHGTPQQRAVANRKVIAFMDELAASRRRAPADDFVSFLVTAEVDGRKLIAQDVRAISVLLFGAGLDTVAVALGFDLYHLARTPADQKRLREDPARILRASEEMLRAYSTVTPIRVATRDLDFLGAPVRKGDLVACPTMVANRDPREFPAPDTVDIEREECRHTAFAYGPHRCMGSHLARREIVIGLEEWLARIPTFRIKQGTAPLTAGGFVFGVENLILDWSPLGGRAS